MSASPFVMMILIYLFIYLVFLSAADEVSKGVMKSE